MPTRRPHKRLRVLILTLFCLGASALSVGRVTTASALTWGGYEIVNDNSNKCLDSNGLTTGPRMLQWQCVANANQIWTLNYTGSGYWYTIVNNASGMCLDVPNNSTDNGVRLQIWPCNGSTAQLWSYHSPGWPIIGYNSGKCMDDYNWDTSNGAAVVIWQCGSTGPGGQLNQEWWLNPGPGQP